ncbi:MAG TPA: beta-N-acetylhexosaminidase [Acidimicrobiales bacterium]|nr:beta-N-acetylhexosaminidase [Acidimicrobiales bacterium]
MPPRARKDRSGVIACVPQPTHVTTRAGALTLSSDSTLAAADGAAARLLRSRIRSSTGFELREGGEDATIRLVLDPQASGNSPERYQISVERKRALIVAAHPIGLMNGVQTFFQLLPPEVFSPVVVVRPWAIPLVEIDDAPCFGWRGFLIDVSRHFFPSEFLFRLVDLLSMHKLNVLHLHLNDDQGWRFPSEAFPRLVEIGSRRRETRIGRERDRSRPGPQFDGTPHGGFYTRDQLRALVSYAAERNVTVMPEIDLPGHAQAAIAAYPELGHVGSIEVATHWGISPHVLNLSDATVTFCKTVWNEVLDVFPSPFVHIGGDECPRDEWRKSRIAKSRLESLGLTNEDALQNWFTAEISAHLLNVGRHPIGWDEILEGGALPVGASVMSWRGESGGIAAAKAGVDVVMSPEVPCYLDHYQSDDPNEPLAIGGRNTLEDVFGWNPVPGLLDADEARSILGAQCNLWTEYVPDPKAVEYMAFPRASAFAEVAWGAFSGDFGEFASRLARHLDRLEALKVNYRPLDGTQPSQQGGSGARRRFDR